MCTALFVNFVTFCRFFRCFKVDFNHQRTSSEVNSVDFLSLISSECVWLLDCFIQVRQINSTRSLVCFKNVAFAT